MTSYMQLLGSDVPNSHGGCCYFGPIDHPAFQLSTDKHTSQDAAADPSSPLSSSSTIARYGATPHTQSALSSSGASGSEGYLFFNCPEGVQRFSSEANIKLGRVKGFLFTRFDAATIKTASASSSSSSTAKSVPKTHTESSDRYFEATRSLGAASAVMGLPGLLFTINDAGVQCAHLFGPSTCWHGPRPNSREPILALRSMTTTTSIDGEVAPGGIERFIVALRKHYFTHRPMRFRLLSPTLVPSSSALATSACATQASTTTSATTTTTAMTCVTTVKDYSSTLPTFYTQDEVFPLATPITGELSTAPPFIVAVMQLSAHSLLIAFRVSGGGGRGSEGEDHASTSTSSPSSPYTWCDTSGLVLSYAILTAPAPAFDAQRARALGVRPGKKFGLLKDGQAVTVDDDDDANNNSGGEETVAKPPPTKRSRVGDAMARHETLPTAAPASGAETVTVEAEQNTTSATTTTATTPRLVQPWQVMCETTASRHVFLSLVLDGDHPRDVQCAVDRLLNGGELEAVLAKQWPDFLYCHANADNNNSDNNTNSTHADEDECELASDRSGGSMRTLVLRHAIHLQPRSYFTGFAMWQKEEQAKRDEEKENGEMRMSGGASKQSRDSTMNVFTAYTHFLFDSFGGTSSTSSHSFSCSPHPASSPSRPCTRSLRSSLKLSVTPSLFESSADSMAGDDPQTASRALTHHVFSADVSERFTAYPTALAHRYHLHLLAPFLFPTVSGAPSLWPRDKAHTTTTDEQEGARAQNAIWPYSYKLRCVTEDARLLGDANGQPVSVPQPHQQQPHPQHQTSKKSKKKAKGEEDFSNNGAGLIRYPTAYSAAALLAESFRTREEGSLARLQTRYNETSDDLSASSTARTVMAAGDFHTNAVQDEGALVFLGTGSAVPSKHRNVSGTYLELRLPAYCFGRTVDSERSTPSAVTLARGVIILDFGEGNSGQLASLLLDRRQRLGLAGEDADRGQPQTPDALHDDRDDDDDEVARFVRDVVLVFISHAHADHHLGLTSLLALRHYYHHILNSPQQSKDKRVRNNTNTNPTSSSNRVPAEAPAQRLLVVCPREVYEYVMDTWGCEAPYTEWLQQEVVFDCMPSAFPRYTQPNDATTPPPSLSQDAPAPAPATEDGSCSATLTVPSHLPRLSALLTSWNACIASTQGTALSSSHRQIWWDADVFTVDHPANAHALLLRYPALPTASSSAACAQLGSRVFLFSGDTRPCRELVARSTAFCDTAGGERVAICLHEATFGPGFESEAVRKKHSTLPEALLVGRDWLQAQSIVLNHFSQRYPKLPGLTEEHLGGVEVDLQCRRRGVVASPPADPATDAPVEPAESVDGDDVDELVTVSASASPPPMETPMSAGHDMCFAFDLMRLPFSVMESGLTAALTPSFVRLLEEYETWTTGTTQRLRD